MRRSEVSRLKKVSSTTVIRENVSNKESRLGGCRDNSSLLSLEVEIKCPGAWFHYFGNDSTISLYNNEGNRNQKSRHLVLLLIKGECHITKSSPSYLYYQNNLTFREILGQWYKWIFKELKSIFIVTFFIFHTERFYTFFDKYLFCDNTRKLFKLGCLHGVYLRSRVNVYK